MLELLELLHFSMIKLRFKTVNRVVELLENFTWTLFTDTLEFNLGPDKRYLKLCETRLAFSIEIPANYTLDNDVFAKMIETTEIVINHESISRKSTPLDNSLTSAIFNKINMETGLLNTSLSTHGIFSSR